MQTASHSIASIASFRSLCFWSSVEYGSFLSGLVRDLNERGVPATQRYQISQRSYRRARTLWQRILLRVRMYGVYPLQLTWAVLTGPRNTVHIVCTNTFYAPILAAWAAWIRGAPTIHLAYDLYPDVLTVAGTLRFDSRICRSMEWLVRKTMHACAANVFLGKRQLRHAADRFGTIPRATVIPVGADARFLATAANDREHHMPPTVLYCGNMGHLHDTDTIARLLLEEANGRSPDPLPPICLRFHANGSGYRSLRTKLGCATATEARFGAVSVRFADSLPESEWRQILSGASVALVTLKADAARIALPSKAYSAMAAGQAILAIGPGDSDLADLIEAHNCGWRVSPGDVTALRPVLHAIASDPETCLSKQRNALRAARTTYDTAILAKQWERLIQEIAVPQSPAPDAIASD